MTLRATGPLFDSPESVSYDAAEKRNRRAMLSLPHLIIIFIVALIVFGPEKLPELARTLGKLTAEFRRVTGDLRYSFEEQMRTLEREAAEIEKKKKDLAAQQAAAAAPKTLAEVPALEATVGNGAGADGEKGTALEANDGTGTAARSSDAPSPVMPEKAANGDA